MERKFNYAVIVLVAFFTLGMGGMVDQDKVDIPEPAHNYSATLVDQSDVSIDMEKFSFGGHTYITGRYGKSDMSIDFDAIDSILFLTDDDHITAHIQMKDSRQIDIVMENGPACLGISTFGNIRTQIRDIKQIQIHGKVVTSNQ